MFSTAEILAPDAPSQDRPEPAPPARKRPPRQRTNRAAFAGLLGMPSIDELLTKKSVELIRERSVQDWALAGGAVRADGSPTLTQPSAEAYCLLRDVQETYPGLWYRDDNGVEWAVLLPPTPVPEETHWHGIAVGLECTPAVVEPQFRQQLLSQMAAELQRAEPSIRELGPGLQALQTHRKLMLRRLQLLDQSLNLVPMLSTAARVSNSGSLQIAPHQLGRALWGQQQETWPSEWSETIFEAVARLNSIHTQRLILALTGWSPMTQQRGRAVQIVKRLPGDQLLIELDPLFVEFLDYWTRWGAWFKANGLPTAKARKTRAEAAHV